MKINLTSAIKRTQKILEKEMTASLRQRALSDGWDIGSASSLSIGVSDKVTTSMASTVGFDHEYGTEGTAPKGTVRKFMNDNTFWKKRASAILKKEAFGGKR